MKYFKTGAIVLILLTIMGCRLTFSPSLKTSITVETNVNIREKDTIKKHKKFIKPLKENSHDKDFK